ncbi:phage tail protein [Oxynema aestuarii]|jgi:phage tail-like protein|uniref:Phage tail protein n=1 Tax=Oxynema aestuarii AP17 TaxID=2064643 RepID=A0A6H1TWU0_9CYAN|nr:phage tail protein [Oxynema aestuarii]QIZ70400.1 phage tail protein [Oxynema aestuarii AP17]RMH73066.1 MAG: phage tail protein [Cyanobacteria bacterium J007]
MADLKPIPTSRFYVEFDGLTDKLVKSITEVTFTGQTAGHEKPLASTKGGKTLWQSTSSGFEENPNFTIEIYLIQDDMDFYNWMLDVMPKSEGGNGKWADSRKNGSIVGYDSGDNEILRWNITNAWPKSYKVSDCAADSKDLAIETLEFVCEQINRVK